MWIVNTKQKYYTLFKAERAKQSLFAETTVVSSGANGKTSLCPVLRQYSYDDNFVTITVLWPESGFGPRGTAIFAVTECGMQKQDARAGRNRMNYSNCYARGEIKTSKA